MQARGLPQEYWDTFRVVFSMSGPVLLLFTTLILLYLDLRGSVLIISSVFLATNLGFAVLTILLGHQYHGYGFLASSIISMVAAFILLAERFKKLEYLTFMRQPL
jgi:polysaccharide biosynthesis protein PelG